MPPKLFQMRYRHPIEGIQHGLIEMFPKRGDTADSLLARATELGRKYCDDNQVRFIWVRDAVLITERPESKAEKAA